jgi:hypothetical protein
LNEFALPRAIVDFERHLFVAWNARFLEEMGYSEEDIKSADTEELLVLSGSWYPISEGNGGEKAEIVSCAAKRHFGASPLSGYVVRARGKFGYLMLDVLDSPTAEFEQGRIVGREEERNRIIQAYHEEVSSSMIAALFLVETAKRELKEAGLPQEEAVSKVSDVLTEATQKIGDVLLDQQASTGGEPGDLPLSSVAENRQNSPQ